MSEEWQYQIRINLSDLAAAAAREQLEDPSLVPLRRILAKHQVDLVCQYDAFAHYVDEAKREGREDDPLYKWTKATIEDPEKKEKYIKSFTVYSGGEQVYDKALADSLEADLQPLVGQGVVTKLSKLDTNPENSPQVPRKYR
ncbi:MAG TPA: hypothetical protein VME69_08340 [Methylocella sp.]|nr:hypothetical protein [Methylocella sp.]